MNDPRPQHSLGYSASATPPNRTGPIVLSCGAVCGAALLAVFVVSMHGLLFPISPTEWLPDGVLLVISAAAMLVEGIAIAARSRLATTAVIAMMMLVEIPILAAVSRRDGLDVLERLELIGTATTLLLLTAGHVYWWRKLRASP